MIVFQVTEEQFTLIRVALAQMERANFTSKEEAIAAMLAGRGGEAQELTENLMAQYQQQLTLDLENSDGTKINVHSETEADTDDSQTEDN